MICSSGIGFDPVLDGRRLTFGFEGIWQGTAVLYDHQTRSLWFHHTGVAIAGPLVGRRLERLDSGRHTQWAAWRRDHPETTVMAREPRYINRGGDQGYFGRRSAHSGSPYLPRSFGATIHTRDDRLPPHTLLHGVYVDGRAHAIPHAVLAEQPVLERMLGEVPIVVFFDTQARSAAAYDRRLGDRTLSFSRDAEGQIHDVGTGSRWDLDGRCVAGRRIGQRLQGVHGLQSEWYGWVAHYPATTIEALAPEGSAEVVPKQPR